MCDKIASYNLIEWQPSSRLFEDTKDVYTQLVFKMFYTTKNANQNYVFTPNIQKVKFDSLVERLKIISQSNKDSKLNQDITSHNNPIYIMELYGSFQGIPICLRVPAKKKTKNPFVHLFTPKQMSTLWVAEVCHSVGLAINKIQ